MQGIAAARLHPLHADPGADPAARPRRPRRGRPGADRHRQDRGLPGRAVQPPADATRRRRPAAERAARHRHRADARARGADPLGRRGSRRSTPASSSRSSSAASTTTSSAATLEEGVDVLIGTPGRIIDYFKQHVFDLRHMQVLVLDEADRMFDLGFIADIRFMLRRLPHPTLRRQHAVLGHPVAPRARARLRAHEQSGARSASSRTR